MKILLVSPRSTENKLPVGLVIPQLALHILAALTPDDILVDIVDEQFSEIDFSTNYDLVGISIMTANALRGYRTAKRFKEKGSKIVFGGIHASVLPEEAITHGDAVVIGEAENSWPILLEDFKNNSLKKFYKCAAPDLTKAPLPKRNMKIDKNVLGLQWPGFYTTKGCPYSCEFCSVSNVYGRKIRHLPIPTVIKDIENAKSRFFLSLDDNIQANPKYAAELFKAMADLNIKWGGQCTVKIADNRELLKLCYRSGCRGLFIGLESVSVGSMSKMPKTYKSIKENEDAIKIIQDTGIVFHPSFVFGLDDDTKAVFDDTLEFLYRNRIVAATFNILTPYPGTKLYQRFKAEGRLLSEDWSRYNHLSVVFRPKNMTCQELAEGYFNLKKEYFSLSNVCRRLMKFGNIPHPGLPQFFYVLFYNIAGAQTMSENYKTLKDFQGQNPVSKSARSGNLSYQA